MSFSSQIAGFGPRAVGRINDLRRGVTMKLFSAVILDTPVDTGRLRANWQCTLERPATGTTEKEDKSGRVPIAEAQAVTNASDGDTPVFLSNNLPYAAKIEFEGWSHTKAPEGMVRRNVVRFGRLIRVQISNTK